MEFDQAWDSHKTGNNARNLSNRRVTIGTAFLGRGPRDNVGIENAVTNARPERKERGRMDIVIRPIRDTDEEEWLRLRHDLWPRDNVE